MGLFDFFKPKQQAIPQVEVKKEPSASYGSYNPLFTISYNGEKNLGELGHIRDYKIDYQALRMRSWQSYLESEITQTVIGRFCKWVVGSGLNLQSNPNKLVLKSEKINLNFEEFNEITEARFKLYSDSKIPDFSAMNNLNKIAKTAFINSIVGGDVLVVLRLVNNQVKIQLIDGAHVCTPYYTDFYNDAIRVGNKIKGGIELNAEGRHIAYFVKTDFNKFERIESINKSTGIVTAFLVIGAEYRLDNHRGIPLIGTVLETLKKLERYKEATVGSAEERQKIAYSIEHEQFSTGENPLIRNMAKAFDVDSLDNDLPKDINGVELANTVAATTNKQAFNMPLGAKLKLLESKNELYFKDFYTTNIELICASIGIPPEVAMSKYDSNFSASRAALKDWEHTLNVERSAFSAQFYKPIYDFWLHIEILKNTISAPGYLVAFAQNNEIVMEAYRGVRFRGANVPHIDPVKEVEAERRKLGEAAKNIPLTTVEQATEAINGGDSDANISQFSEELKESLRLGITSEQTNNRANE